MQVAGAEVLVREFIRSLGSRIVPHVYCLDAVGPIGEELIAEGVPVVAFNRKPGLDWPLVGRMASRMRADRIEIVHAHQYTPFFYSSLAAVRSGQRPRVIFTEHGRHYPDVVSWKRRLTNRIFFSRLADETTAVCQFSADALVANEGFARKPVRVIPNGIDVSRYDAVTDKAAVRVALGLEPGRRYVTIVARFHPVKDHATLIRAFGRLAPRHDDVDLLLVGDGPLRPDIERQIASLGLADRIRLVGVQANVPDWLRASDVFVLCSVSEAASVTLLEAMACGLPVVVSAVGGNPELARAGLDGLHVARGDDEALAGAIGHLLTHPDEAARMGLAGAARVRTDFRMSTTVDRYADLFGCPPVQSDASTSGVTPRRPITE
jgi:glycosyltransferase involved in cell wall biosynthesis